MVKHKYCDACSGKSEADFVMGVQVCLLMLFQMQIVMILLWSEALKTSEEEKEAKVIELLFKDTVDLSCLLDFFLKKLLGICYIFDNSEPFLTIITCLSICYLVT